MATTSYVRSLASSAKRLRLDAPRAAFSTTINQRVASSHPNNASIIPGSDVPLLEDHPATRHLPANIQHEIANLRLPRAVQAAYLAPLRRKSSEDSSIRSADLQLRGFNPRDLVLFADFCMRAAYYLNLPARGPVPLPRITERWTVPRGNFVHKKSQENFERVTMRRLIQIRDGHPETVSIWLAFIQKHQYHGIGMKANVWEYSGLDVVEDLDAEAKKIRARLGDKFELFGASKEVIEGTGEKELQKWIHDEPFKGVWGAYAPMGGAQSVPHANTRIEKHRVGGGPT